MLKMNYGRVYIEICKPMSMKGYINNIGMKKLTNQIEKTNAVKKLGKEIIYQLTDKLVVMNTGIVSCVLLMNRRGISEDNLIQSVNWIVKYILKKGYKIGGIN